MMPSRDWSKHQLTQPPEDEDGWRNWFTDAFWIFLEKLERITMVGCPAHAEIVSRLGMTEHQLVEADRMIDEGRTTWDKVNGYVKGILIVLAALFALSAMVANVATAVVAISQSTGGRVP